MLKTRFTSILLFAGLFTLLTACSPEVGSEAWCKAMQDKPKGDWTANEAAEYAGNCLVGKD